MFVKCVIWLRGSSILSLSWIYCSNNVYLVMYLLCVHVWPIWHVHMWVSLYRSIWVYCPNSVYVVAAYCELLMYLSASWSSFKSSVLGIAYRYDSWPASKLVNRVFEFMGLCICVLLSMTVLSISKCILLCGILLGCLLNLCFVWLGRRFNNHLFSMLLIAHRFNKISQGYVFVWVAYGIPDMQYMCYVFIAIDVYHS